MIDTGKAQVDQTLFNALINLKIKELDAKELARVDAFGGQQVPPWIEGLKAAAVLLNQGNITLDWGTLPTPWDTVCPAIISGNGSGPGVALAQAISSFGVEIQSALLGALGTIAQNLAQQASKSQHVDVSNVVNPNRAASAQQLSAIMQPVNIKLVRQIQSALHGKGSKDERRKRAGEQLMDWLQENGKFIRTVYGNRYYLYRTTHKLYMLDTDIWHAWLYLATGCNPASADFRYLVADCQTAAFEGENMEVVRVAHWDDEQQVLRVSRFDGQVYRLDGMTMELEANGDGPVLFDDAMSWIPYEPEFGSKGSVLEWSTNTLPHWDGDRTSSGLLYQCWWLATFFTELCPTRPILTIKGEKGSGKSMALRIILKFLFGPTADVVGVPEKADAFTSVTSNSHIVVMDNMDVVNKDIRDKIAALSTGKTDQLRKLYTTNESQIIRYRCWLAVTSRTPDTLQRDDLVDRLLLLPVDRIQDGDRARESRFLSDTLTKRGQWWGDILLALNSIVAEIHRTGIPDRGGLRMEDWAALSTVIARALGQDDIWEKGLKEVKSRQATFLLEDDVIVQAIETWLASPHRVPTPILTRDLYQQCKLASFGTDRPDSNWPRSVKSFGRRLVGIQRELQAYLQESGWQMRWKKDRNGILEYSFNHTYP